MKIVPSKEIVSFLLKKNGFFPNNAYLPVLIYREGIPLSEKGAEKIEVLLQANGWKHCWRNGIYSFHHYHSNTHEVLVVYQGSCRVQLGGEGSFIYTFERNDVLILPVGTTHKNVGSSEDFRCIGAYPFDIEYDMNYGKENEMTEAEKKIKETPLPKKDPIYGANGPLFSFWK